MSTLECPSCGFANRRDALFCGSCGIALGKPCPACGEVAEIGLAYCTACGAELSALPAPRPSAEERKVVTVLFADLVGSTGRAERLDPEDVRRLLDTFHVRLRGELERYGGTVEKYIGDAVMALFGAPRAHEDDPERAVRAALSLREAIGELNAADPDLGLRLRIGITTGEAFVNLAANPAAGESMAAGDIVNTAARLQTAAPVDGILVDEATERASREAIEYRPAEPVRARGRKEEVRVWEVVAPRARLGVDIAFRGGAELIGRDRELDLLLGALARSERERSPELVTLVGVPGIGKSRLLWELYTRLHADPSVFVTWRQGRSLPYGEGVSFWALGEMVKSHAGILESDGAEATEEKLHAAVATALADPGATRWVLGHLRPLVGLGGNGQLGADTRTEAFAAWRRFFEALAERRPLILVFEDLHWADDGLLDFVNHLVDWAAGVPLLVVCTARPELLERRPAWGGGKRNALTASLAPLSDEDTARLVGALLTGKLVQTERQSELLARAGGNPLYAEEYVRMLAQPEAEEELPLPESVHGIIAARLDTLPPDEKAVLQDASIVGKVFWAGALAALGGLDEASVEERLRTLDRKEFVRRERRSSVAGETAYVFRHGLVRDVAYGQIPRALRAEKHRLAAGWIETLAGDRAEDLADLVAHHYLSALQFARASGREVEALAGPARRALREAGDRALALNAFSSAASFYEEALELWPESDSERPRVLLRHGQALFHAAGTGADVLAEAAEELLDLGDREAAAEAYIVLSDLSHFVDGRDGDAVERLEAAALLLAERPPSPSKVAVLANRARFHMIADEAEDAIRVGFEALVAAEEMDLPEFRAHALNTLGFSRVMIGDPGGIPDLERSIAIAEELNSTEAIRAHNNLSALSAELGDLGRAYEHHGHALRLAERFGHTLALRWLTAQRMDELYWTGRWDDAVDLAGEIIAAAETAPGPIQLLDARTIRARVRLARGDHTGAAADSQEAASGAREAGEPQVAFPALAACAHVLVSTGRSDEAHAVASELLASWRASPTTLAGSWLPDLTAVLLALGREDELAEAVEHVGAPTRWLEAARVLSAGDASRAAQIYAEIGSLPDEADSRLRAAPALLAAGRLAEAEGELERALSFFRRVRADTYIRAAEELLAPT
jgi:class 3 adenylate cyclase/tetratricopeptide (TPR) repeat protein